MWYVVQTMAGREFAVQRQIEQFASDDVLDECFVPQYEVQKHRLNCEASRTPRGE